MTVRWPVSQSVSQSVIQSVSQSVSQSVGLAISQKQRQPANRNYEKKRLNTHLTNLPSQSSDPEHEITVDVAAKEDVVVGKIDGLETAVLVKLKEDAEK